MFVWYRNAEVCLAYLADVDTTHDIGRFTKSEWFERDWTLQELLAPNTVVFLTESWQVIGNKGALFHKYSAPGRVCATKNVIRPERLRLHAYAWPLRHNP